ncbi:MAG: phage tail tape measure protein, partial [Ignavibacteria bacterium]
MAVDAGSIYSEIRIQLDSLNGDIQKVQASFDKLGTNLGQTSEKTKKKIGNDLQQINLAHVALFAAIGLAIKKFISGYAEFEQSLANVQSVSRASAEDMAILEKAASKAGQTTKFSGKQAADAMYYLASAGFTARQSVEALDGVLSLASATGADLAFTAETVASAISQFGLQAKDSEKVANVFAMGIANSQATIDKLAVSMRYVGPVANAFKMTIEDTVGVLQILYNAGFEASQAGTALRSVLADLSNAASPAVDKLEKMGINFEKVNPAMVGFSDIIRNLNPIATDAGKIMEIFGDRAGPVMIKLLKEGGDQIDIYTKQVTGTNQAANAAAIQNDTLQFAMGRLNKSFTSVGKSIVSEFAPGMKVAANFLADLFFKFSQLPAPIKIFIGTAGAVIVAITGISTAVSLFSSVLGASTLPILAVTGGIAGLVAISSILYKVYNQTKDNTIILKKTQGDLENSTNTLKESIDKYKKANDELNDKTKDLNETELATLEIRKRLAGLEVLANLGKTLKAIENFDKALKDQNNSVLENQRNYSNAAKGLVAYEKEVERLTKLQDERNEMSIAERNTTANVSTELAKANQWLKTYEESTRKNSTALAESQLALANANKSRQEQIDVLANALNLGQIQIKDI